MSDHTTHTDLDRGISEDCVECEGAQCDAHRGGYHDIEDLHGCIECVEDRDERVGRAQEAAWAQQREQEDERDHLDR